MIITNNRIWDIAKELGADQIKINRGSSSSQSVKFERNVFTNVKDATSVENATLKIYKDGNTIGVYLYDLHDETLVKRLIKSKIELLKFKTKEVDESLTDLSGMQYLKPTKDKFEPLEINRAKELLQVLFTKINNELENIVVANTAVHYSVGSSSSQLFTSDNVFLEKDSGLKFNIVAVVYGEKGEETAAVYETRLYSNESQIDFNEIVANLKYVLNKNLDKIEIESKKYEIVFAQDGFQPFLEEMLIHLEGRNVIDKLSKWGDKIGKKVLSDSITLIDRPIFKEFGLYSTYDSNGVATHETKFIENGILNQYLVDAKTAALLKVKDNGNSMGSGSGFHFLSIEPGTKTEQEILSTIKDGILIDGLKGFHSSLNTTSGEFSLEIDGNVITNGVIGKRIRTGVLSGNFFDDVAFNIGDVSSQIDFNKTNSSPMIKISKKMFVTT